MDLAEGESGGDGESRQGPGPEEIAVELTSNNCNEDSEDNGDAGDHDPAAVVGNDAPLFQLREAWPPFVPDEEGLEDGSRALVVCTIDVKLLTGGCDFSFFRTTTVIYLSLIHI